MVLSARNTRNGMWCGCLNQRICLKLDAPIYVEKSGVLTFWDNHCWFFEKSLEFRLCCNWNFLCWTTGFIYGSFSPLMNWSSKFSGRTSNPIFAQTPKISKNTIDGYIIKYPQKLHRFLPHLSPKKYSTNLSLGEASRSLIKSDPCLVSFKIITYGNEFSSQQKTSGFYYHDNTVPKKILVCMVFWSCSH